MSKNLIIFSLFMCVSLHACQEVRFSEVWQRGAIVLSDNKRFPVIKYVSHNNSDCNTFCKRITLFRYKDIYVPEYGDYGILQITKYTDSNTFSAQITCSKKDSIFRQHFTINVAIDNYPLMMEVYKKWLEQNKEIHKSTVY